MSKEKYMEDRNKAMLMYPDTKGLDDLVKNYPEYFDERFCRYWDFIGKTKPSSKLRTLEKMILSWDGAPSELKKRVNQRHSLQAFFDDFLENIGHVDEFIGMELEDNDKDESGLIED